MARKLPRYCVEDRDRHGNWRVYYRREGRKVRLQGLPWSDEFMAAYRAALDGVPPPAANKPDTKAPPARPTRKPPTAGTWRWLCTEYFAKCSTYLRYDETTRDAYRRSLEGTFDEPIKPGSPRHFGDMPIAAMSDAAIRVLRDRKIKTPEAANLRLKTARAVYEWAVEEKLAKINPAASVKAFKSASTGHHTWTIDEVRRFEARHPVGTKPRLALALLLYTGARRSDAVLLGRQHVTKRGWLRWTAFKNRNRNPVEIEIPILPALQAIIDATPSGHLNFLTTKFGEPYTRAGFSGQFRDWCDQAGLKHCSAHGLRKAGATIAGENGASELQLMAIYGWTDPKMATRYTQAARRKRLAGAAMGLLDLDENEYKEVPPASDLPSGGTKTA